jgi:hypothetical protein
MMKPIGDSLPLLPLGLAKLVDTFYLEERRPIIVATMRAVAEDLNTKKHFVAAQWVDMWATDIERIAL